MSAPQEQRQKRSFLGRISPFKRAGGGTSPQSTMGNGASSQSSGGSKVCLSDGRNLSTQDMAKLIPQLESQLEQSKQDLRRSQNSASDQASKIQQLEQKVKDLQHECDKLRSVLSKKVSTPATPGPINDEHSPPQQRQNKKQGVSAESDAMRKDVVTLTHHKKSAESRALIKQAIQQNDFLKHLDGAQVAEIVECMYERQAPKDVYIIREGDQGQHLYVGAAGELEVSKEAKVLGRMQPGRVFGELALLYNCTRTASVKALSDTRLWVLDRSVFQAITQRLGLQKQEMLLSFLRQVPLLKGFPDERLGRLADLLDQDFYQEGTTIVREGDRGDRFYIISSGRVRITQQVDGFSEPQEVRVLEKGEYFGEKALVADEPRTATATSLPPGVELLALDKESFQKLIGDLQEIRSIDYGDEKRGATRLRSTVGYDSVAEAKKELSEVEAEFLAVELSHLQPIATLGVGGFGRVEMVHIAGDRSRAFALKAMKKRHIVDTRQQEHIFSERNIMLEMRCTFVVRLYKTFRDKKYIYMLLEACLGGELWTILRDRGHFDEVQARFYTSCVLEALEFLHRRGIIYRDLKPENCLLDQTGYLKIVDFGFAKKLGGGRKTWTFCGTPEYVAPEIILNKGHDHSADFWALGIYICELLLGRPPFQAQDPMKTYTLILKGVDALDIPNKRIGKIVTTLVKKLCRDNPSERLGCQSGGIDDIRKHKWFIGFDFSALRTRSLKPPIIPKVSNPLDASNFDQYPPETDVPPDEISGWDDGF